MSGGKYHQDDMPDAFDPLLIDCPLIIRLDGNRALRGPWEKWRFKRSLLVDQR
jgi:hypothetical protein